MAQALDPKLVVPGGKPLADIYKIPYQGNVRSTPSSAFADVKGIDFFVPLFSGYCGLAGSALPQWLEEGLACNFRLNALTSGGIGAEELTVWQRRDRGCYGVARRPRDSATLPRGASMVQICVPCVVMQEAMS
jgi:hypothetical protein